MGRFFSTVQIKNGKGSREQFISSFCEVMQKRNLVQCTDDEAEVQYILAFSEGGWVTLASDVYKSASKQAHDDAQQTAKEMNTSSFSMEVVDSDWAIIGLHTGANIHDTVIVGRSAFPEEQSPKGRQECWEQLLAQGKTWEQLSEIWNKNEVFVEDAMQEAASVLGIEPKYMISEYDDFNSEADTNSDILPLFFKKNITVSKNGEKKLTLNAAFKQVFGEALEPLGFVKAKTKYPYYIRFVDNSFIQIIGLKKESENDFNIIAGIATIYRSEIELNCSPRMNCNWLIGVSEIYQRKHLYDYDRQYRKSIMHFGFPKIENKIVIKEFGRALDAVKEWVLPEFKKVQKLSDVIDYLFTFYIPGLDIFGPEVQFYRHVKDRDGLFCFELDAPYEIADRRSENAIKCALYKAEHNIEGFTKTDYTKSCESIKQSNKELKEYINSILNNKNLYDETMEEIKQRKERNIRILRLYGLDIENDKKIISKANAMNHEKTEADKGEKKLTLIAAFKQVFGEALEPLGFVKAKTKYPYYVRVIGDEIVQVVAVKEEFGSTFDIVSGIATVYRAKIDLSQSVKFNTNWLMTIANYYSCLKYYDTDYDDYYRRKIMFFNFRFTNNDDKINIFNYALEQFKKWVLPMLNKIDSIQKVYEYFSKYFSSELHIETPDNFKRINSENESLTLFNFNDPYAEMDKRFKKSMEQIDFVFNI